MKIDAVNYEEFEDVERKVKTSADFRGLVEGRNVLPHYHRRVKILPQR